jgi:large subunit ribosomal protein L9
MEIILLERIEKLGQMGDVVKVKPGFARNFLLPRKKALRATEENKRQFEGRRGQLETESLKLRSEAEKAAAKMEGLDVVLVRQAGEAGQLYGSVNARDIATAVTKAGFTINRQQVRLDKPIKALGFYGVHVELHPEVAVGVNANVARSEEEAKIQAKTGKAVVSSEEEDLRQEEDVARKAAEEAEKVFEQGAAPDSETLTDDTAADHSEEEATAKGAEGATEKSQES